jgi:hypothetical protein
MGHRSWTSSRFWARSGNGEGCRSTSRRVAGPDTGFPSASAPSMAVIFPSARLGPDARGDRQVPGTLHPVEPSLEPWWRVRQPEALDGDLAPLLASVDSLQRAWADVVAHATPEEFQASRRRSLRRHAIETGILERLYDVDWGVTQALVAEGLSAEVAEREGGIDETAPRPPDCRNSSRWSIPRPAGR